ncbi:Bgt-21003 [Blumeria graminis f. sp. tritici]|uniref:Bgt-21003 n=2 Tax=Blumeria graminis f. sp. tritici TaxID=62690 RepID=A0A9X9MGQ6_BLUGR|nr:Bgt-21003 [Blumeria graminis f. sp. tritici]
MYKGEYQYRIKWRDSTDSTQEPLKNVIFASKAIKEFEINYLKKKKPTEKDIEKAKKEVQRTAILRIDQDLDDLYFIISFFSKPLDYSFQLIGCIY